MDRKTYLDSINAGGIDHRRVQWQTEVKPAAAHRARSLRKATTALVMTGASYADLGVNANVQTGELPWGEWAEFPHIITHKGKEYARLYVLDGTIQTVYMVDGDVVDRETFKGYLTPSQANAPAPNGGCITVTLDNVKVVS